MTARTGSGYRIVAVVVLVLMGLTLFAACGGNGGDDDDDALPSSWGASDAESLPPGGDIEFAESEDEESVGDGERAGAPAFDTSYVASQAPLDRLVIRTATITLTVENVQQGTIWIRDLAARKSGFVFSSNTYVRNESEFAQITIRVPADQFDSAILELREHELVVRVDSEESTSQDVSQEYVDNDARLRALEETQRRFLQLLSEASTIDAILRIESELTSIRSQIETIKGRQSYLDQMTAFSTITISLHVENNDIEPMSDDDESFLARVFGDSWDRASGVIEGLLAATITLGIIGLAILPFGLIFYFAGKLAYRRTGRGQPRVVAAPAETSPE